MEYLGLLDEIPSNISYKNITTEMPTIHIGQRKLIVSEMRFLTVNLPTYDHSCIVVYAGASPCNHLYALMQLFPNVKFVLVDPKHVSIHVKGTKKTHISSNLNSVIYLRITPGCRENGVVNALVNGVVDKILLQNDTHLENDMEAVILAIRDLQYRVYIIENILDEELCKALSCLKPYLWSDIRTNILNKKTPSDLDLLWNLSSQLNWVKEMSPVSSMLKFRQPFYGDDMSVFKDINEEISACFRKSLKYGIDFVGNYKTKKFRYLDGRLFVQAWSKTTSAETRLHTSGFNFTNYDIYDYERRMFYYNVVRRSSTIHNNPLFDKKLGSDFCGDCALESRIVMYYEEKYKVETRYDWHNMVLRSTSYRGLLRGKHGKLYEDFDETVIHDIVRELDSN